MGVIQARLSSSRCPGKVLRRVHGKPLLQYLIERLALCHRLTGFVVVTSEESEDDAIERFCQERGLPCVRGPLEDVAARFLQTFEAHPADAYVRICADSPLLDPSLVDQMIELFERTRPDLATNLYPRSFPKGQAVEVINPEAFARAYPQFRGEEDCEHVTSFFYTADHDFRIQNFRTEPSFWREDQVVDHEWQLQRFARLVGAMQRPHWSYDWRELMTLSKSLPRESHPPASAYPTGATP